MATNEEKKNGIYKVGADGKGPSGLTVGDQVVTAAGTYTVTGVNADGTYKSQLTNKGQTTSNYTGQYNTVPTTAGGTTGSGYKTLNEQVYGGLNDSAVVNTYKDGNGNTIKEFSKEATKASEDLYNQQVQNQVDYINKNPSAVNAFGSDEFMSLYGDVYTTAPNGTQVKIKDLVDVGNGTYTYDASKAEAARAQGYTVTTTTYAGKPAYYIKGIKKETPAGTSGADESLLSDTQYAALLYERDLWNKDNALYQQALAAGDTVSAEQYKASRDQHHLNVERLRAGSWLGGYSGGTDGSMYIDYKMEAAKGNMPAYTDSVQRFLDVKGIDYTLPSWQQGAESSGGSSVSGSGSTGGYTGSSGSLSGGTTSAPTLNGSGNVTSPTFKVNDYSQYIQDMYDAKREAAIAALEAAYQQNINSINRAGEGIAETYQNARNQTAGASELAKRNFAQYAAANGLNSGTGGQAELARNVTLQNNLNSINNAEGQSIADLELQRANAEAEYNNAIAQAEATGNYELANALYQEKVRYETALNNAIQQEFQNAVTNYQLQYQAYRDSVGDNQWEKAFAQQVAQQNWQNNFNQTQYDDTLAQQEWLNNFNQTQYNNSQIQQNFENAFLLQQYWDSLEQQNAENLLAQNKYNTDLANQAQEDLASTGWSFLKIGAMPSNEMLSAMNLSSSEAQNYIDTLKASQNKGNTGTASKPDLTFSQVMSAIESGMVTPAVKDAFEYYNGVPYDEYINPETPATGSDTGTSPGLNLMDTMKEAAANTGLGQLVQNNTQHTMGLYTVDVTLSNMQKAGANYTELRAALREALATGLLTQAEYESLCEKYLPSGWRN